MPGRRQLAELVDIQGHDVHEVVLILAQAPVNLQECRRSASGQPGIEIGMASHHAQRRGRIRHQCLPAGQRGPVRLWQPGRWRVRGQQLIGQLNPDIEIQRHVRTAQRQVQGRQQVRLIGHQQPQCEQAFGGVSTSRAGKAGQYDFELA